MLLWWSDTSTAGDERGGDTAGIEHGGVLMMVRVSTDPETREQRLEEARKFFIKALAEEWICFA